MITDKIEKDTVIVLYLDCRPSVILCVESSPRLPFHDAIDYLGHSLTSERVSARVSASTYPILSPPSTLSRYIDIGGGKAGINVSKGSSKHL